MGFLNIDADEASAVKDYRVAESNLKPVGLYRVQVEKVEFHAPEGKVPYLNFWLRVVGFLGKGDNGFVTAKGSNKPSFANSMLFAKAFLSSKALFALENAYFVFNGEELAGADLAKKVNSFTTQAKLLAWVNSWADPDVEVDVWVSHDKTGKKPQEKVSWQLPKA